MEVHATDKTAVPPPNVSPGHNSHHCREARNRGKYSQRRNNRRRVLQSSSGLVNGSNLWMQVILATCDCTTSPQALSQSAWQVSIDQFTANHSESASELLTTITKVPCDAAHSSLTSLHTHKLFKQDVCTHKTCLWVRAQHRNHQNTRIQTYLKAFGENRSYETETYRRL